MENETNVPLQLSLGFCISILKNMNINFTAKELKNPSSDTLYVIYKAFLSECLTIHHDAYEKDHLVDVILNFNEEAIKNQSESFKLMQFYIIIKYFFDLCGINPSYMEIFHPMKNKFPKLLSGMISFCRFEFQELELINISQLLTDTKEYVRRCAEEKQEIEELQSRIYYINSDNIKNKPLVEQCKKRSAALKEKNSIINEERKKLQAECENYDREEAALEAEAKELQERISQCKKKFVLYDKLIVKSPQRLNKELEKNEARIIELKKLSASVTTEIDAEKRNLFEREKFIESSQSIMEILEVHFLNTVQSANSKKREIESVKEEITNLNFIHAQTESTIESLTKTYENLNGNVDNFSKESQLKLVQYHDKLELIKRQMNGIQNKFRDYDAEKNNLTRKINEAKVQSNDLINNAMEKIQMFQKNEAFAKTIAAAKLKTMSSYNEMSNQKVGDALARMKKSLDMFKKYDKEARNM